MRDPGLHGSPRDDQSDRREQCHDEKETGEAQQRPDYPEFGLSEDKNCRTEKDNAVNNATMAIPQTPHLTSASMRVRQRRTIPSNTARPRPLRPRL